MTRWPTHILLMLKKPATLSPGLIEHLLDSLPPEITDRGGAISYLCNEIISNAERFCYRFKDSYFLSEEPVHEFVAIQYRDEDTGFVDEELRCRLLLTERASRMGIFLPTEMPIDEMYDVHHIIAESQLPEFWDDHAKPQSEN